MSLLRQSSGISRAVYSTQWYEPQARIKTEVWMIMLRSQTPSCITAGKIYVMHLENFSSVKNIYIKRRYVVHTWQIMKQLLYPPTFADTQYCTIILHDASKLRRIEAWNSAESYGVT